MEESILPTQGEQLQAGEGSPGEVAPPDYFTQMVVSTFITQVQERMQTDLLPRAGEIISDVHCMQHDASQVSARAEEEAQEVDAELARLTGLMASFQQNMAALLPGLG